MSARRSGAPLAAALVLSCAPPATAAAAPAAVRIWAGDHRFTDAAGRTWHPAGGRMDGRRVPIRRPLDITASPRLYATLADGITRARLRLPRAGRYVITLYLGAPRGSRTRRFSVTAARRRAVVEVPVSNGLQRPLHTAFETVVRGRGVTLRFRALHGRPVVAAVEAQRLGPVTMAGIRRRFAEGFDGPAGSAPGAAWTVLAGSRWGGGQLQSYTARPENVALDGAGHLRVTALRERYANPDGHVAEYTSGRIETAFTTRLTRARVSARIRVPQGAGLWPTFWANGAEPPVWPASGEVDIMELAGQRPALLYGFVHGPQSPGSAMPYQNGVASHRRTPFADASHDYAIATEPGVVQFLLDGRRYGSVSRADIPQGAPWLLGRPYHLVLSLAVGGFGGDVGAATRFPAVLAVDRVALSR